MKDSFYRSKGLNDLLKEIFILNSRTNHEII